MKKADEQQYWDKVYEANAYECGPIPDGSSSFAQSIAPLIAPESVVVELGCGNGRDALFLSNQENVKKVVGLDYSQIAIAKLKPHENEKLQFGMQDFSNIPERFLESLNVNQMDVAYSRFTLHSVKKSDASKALEWTYEHLADGGMFLIEVRSIQDPLCGQGTPVEGERDAFIATHHYRRFLRLEELTSELVALGFHLEYVVLSNNLSVYKNDNPVLIRVHARKLKK